MWTYMFLQLPPFIFAQLLANSCSVFWAAMQLLVRLKTIVFVSIILFFFLSWQTKFSGQTRNLYRYGSRVDLRTLTHLQQP